MFITGHTVAFVLKTYSYISDRIIIDIKTDFNGRKLLGAAMFMIEIANLIWSFWIHKVILMCGSLYYENLANNFCHHGTISIYFIFKSWLLCVGHNSFIMDTLTLRSKGYVQFQMSVFFTIFERIHEKKTRKNDI